MLSIIRAVLTGLLVVSFVGACNDRSVSEQKVGGFQRSNFMDFVDSVDSFPYSMSQEKKEQFLESLPLIEIGMDKEVVSQALGVPDVESFTYTRGGDGSDAELVNSTWAYYLYREERELAGDRDLVVYVYFNKNNVVYEIVSPE